MGGNSAPSVEFGSVGCGYGNYLRPRHNTPSADALGKGSVLQGRFKPSSRELQAAFKESSLRLQMAFKAISRGLELNFSASDSRVQENFEPYQTANQSRLEPWREQIVQMRRLNWPYLKISQWLAEHTGITVSLQAVHQFCKVRDIQKGGASKPPPPRKTTPSRRPAKKPKRSSKKRFEYNEADQPIDLTNLKAQK